MKTYSFQRLDEYKESDKAKTIAHRDYKSATDLVCRKIQNGGINVEYSVRRLTVTECERLQGFQDNWTQIGEEDLETHEWYYIDEDGKRRKVSDSARYRAIGNSIATPFWFYLLRRISAQYERPATMGSLFSGIGGFEYCWEKCNGKGTALFASEIEPFCIAVTKEHFSE